MSKKLLGGAGDDTIGDAFIMLSDAFEFFEALSCKSRMCYRI